MNAYEAKQHEAVTDILVLLVGTSLSGLDASARDVLVEALKLAYTKGRVDGQRDAFEVAKKAVKS